jgi:hypothetical protein
MGYHHFKVNCRRGPNEMNRYYQIDLTFRLPEEPEVEVSLELKAGSYRGDARQCIGELTEGALRYPGVYCLFLARFEEGWERQNIERALDGARNAADRRCEIVCLGKVDPLDCWWVGHLTVPGNGGGESKQPGVLTHGPTPST